MTMKVTLDIFSELVRHVLFSQRTDFSEFSSQEIIFYHAYTFMLEVSNGGLHQFLFNHSGEHTKETISSLNDAGLDEASKILIKAIKLFPSEDVPIETSARRELLEDININQLRELDDIFYKVSDEFDSKLLDYVQQNMLEIVLSITLQSAISKADVEFANKDFKAVVDILEPYKHILPATKSTKFKMAIKKNAT